VEELDFEAALITSYGYEVYRHGERLYWYDDYPHPDDPVLALTFPHHKARAARCQTPSRPGAGDPF